MITKIAELCHEKRRHLQHARVDRRRRRDAQRSASGEERLREGERDHPRHAGAAEARARSTSASPRRSSTRTSTTAKTSSPGRRRKARHRLQHGPLHRPDARQRRPGEHACKPIGADEERMRQFFLDRVRMDSAARRPELHPHALRRHDRQRLPPARRRARSRRRASC